MRKLSVVLMAVGFMSVTVAQQKKIDASPETIQAMHSFMRCVNLNIPLLDDKISDASVVGSAVGSACRKEGNSFYDAIAREDGSSASYTDVTRLNSEIDRMATSSVLEKRVKDRKR